jgi:hypothetical protein
MEPNETNGGRRREIALSLGPLKVTLRGYDVLLTLICCGLVGLGTLIYYNDKAGAKEMEAFHTQHHIIIEAQKRQEDAFREMTYVISLPQDKRDKLNLEMPDSLRKRIDARRGD